MKVGQRVVCIDGFHQNPVFRINYPVKGEIYTIRGICKYNGKLGLLLEEIINPIFPFINGIVEPAFDIDSFRELNDDFGKEICERIEEEIKQEEKETVPA